MKQMKVTRNNEVKKEEKKQSGGQYIYIKIVYKIFFFFFFRIKKKIFLKNILFLTIFFSFQLVYGCFSSFAVIIFLLKRNRYENDIRFWLERYPLEQLQANLATLALWSN